MKHIYHELEKRISSRKINQLLRNCRTSERKPLSFRFFHLARSQEIVLPHDTIISQAIKTQDILTLDIDVDEPMQAIVKIDKINAVALQSSSSNSASDDEEFEETQNALEDPPEAIESDEEEAEEGSWRKAYLNTQQDDSGSRERNSRQDLLLHASLQLTEDATYYYNEILTIYHAVRNFKKKGTCNVHELLPRLHRLVMKDRMPFYLSAGISTVLSGWVTCAAPRQFLGVTTPLWPSRRKVWCVLWNSKLAFFKNSEYSRKYMLALSRQQRGAWSLVGQRMMKEYAPETKINIQGWEARLTENNDCSVSLYDFEDNLQHVMEFETANEAHAWMEKIASESQRALCQRQKQLSQAKATDYVDGLRVPLDIPLKWLRVRVDRVDKTARRTRMICASLSQAMKDITRDNICINGTVLSGSCIEDILSELAVGIMKHADELPRFREMDAVQFSRRALISSARTQGGGDVLDAVHTLLSNPDICICPDPTLVDPVELIVSKQEGKPVVEIKMKMYFRLVHLDEASTGETLGHIVGISHQRLICQLKEISQDQGHVELHLHSN